MLLLILLLINWVKYYQSPRLPELFPLSLTVSLPASWLLGRGEIS
jgi:hypothetical protein